MDHIPVASEPMADVCYDIRYLAYCTLQNKPVFNRGGGFDALSVRRMHHTCIIPYYA